MCPVCREPMVAYELEGVEIDHCLRCLGTWLDAGELARITALAGVEPGELSDALAVGKDGLRTRRKCPRCPNRLREAAIGREASVTLDRCPDGHGLWFDQGELVAVIRSHGDDQEEQVASFFGELYRSELNAAQKGP